VFFRKIEIKELSPDKSAEKRAFVLLGGQGVAERSFDTLPEAVVAANDGDTIEIRGNGPFVSEPARIHHALTIRGGTGFRPVIKLLPTASDPGTNLITCRSSLVLEGLELWGNDRANAIIQINDRAPLHIANCRLFRNGSKQSLQLDSQLCRLTNCDIQTVESILALPRQRQFELHGDNCVLAGLRVNRFWAPGNGRAQVRITRSTWALNALLLSIIYDMPLQAPDKEQTRDSVSFDVSNSVLSAQVSFLQFHRRHPGREAKILSQEEADRLLRHFLHWRGERNAYAFFPRGVLIHAANNLDLDPIQTKGLKEWQQFWGPDERDGVEGNIKFQGGELFTRAKSDEQLTPDDFRLLPDSPGYRAGPDGKDLGTDVDLVGPGAAYERWKKTPEYREWLKETGQMK
jgi:hypothetical protein